MTMLIPHHPTQALAELEAQRVADQAQRPMAVWHGRAHHGAGRSSECWTVTSATRDFPACCAMRREATIHPRNPR